MKFIMFVIMTLLSFNVLSEKQKITYFYDNKPPTISPTEDCYFSSKKLAPNWVFYINPYGDEGFTHPACVPRSYYLHPYVEQYTNPLKIIKGK